MNSKRYTLLALTALVIASGLLAGCGGSKDPEPGKNDPAEVKQMRKEKEGGE